jgi:hypothetical protein
MATNYSLQTAQNSQLETRSSKLVVKISPQVPVESISCHQSAYNQHATAKICRQNHKLLNLSAENQPASKLTEFTESGLRFGFEPAWAVKKYDQHRFFQGLSGAGLKGVDFIAINGERLVLVEVKNYRPLPHIQQANPVEAVLANPEALAAAIAQKATDTLRGLEAIGGYYQRKWLFRLLQPLLLRLRPHGWDWRFWAHACHLQPLPQHITFVLWLETEQARLAFRRQLAQALEQRLHGLVGTVVVAGNGENWEDLRAEG